ncbi:MAG: cupin domain-containing protein [Gemmataceae bacterium]|nr:cupin domain-containing protein [Gemmataceae bacterium]MCS7270464.1 cupin domain-containing protein [Gemmataceae bacterium]MDW8242720.1 cupin domain-containing protein [Thermogemmata sp.]
MIVPGCSVAYVVRHEREAPQVPCPCGLSTRILTAADGAPCSVHVTVIRDALLHYHRHTTEVYYILEGSGKIELDGAWHAVEPGTVVWIPPGVRHRVFSPEGLRTIVFALPAFDPQDEWLVSSENEKPV